MKITQDPDFVTHIDWEHEGITAKMVDWFWSNLEKCMLLWHPSQHEPLEWAVMPQNENPVGSVHIAPQTWSDGTRLNLYIRFEDLQQVPDKVKSFIIYEHVVIVGGFIGDIPAEGVPFAYRIHQWEKTDYGIVGKSSAIGYTKEDTKESGLVWAEHCAEEIGNWEYFLPQIYNLYKVVKNTTYNPYSDLSVSGKGVDASYKHIK